MEPLSTATLPDPRSPGLTALLPFLYVAWADGLLGPEEVAALRAGVEAQPWLSAEDRRTVSGWLDAEQPPAAAAYYGCVRTLRDEAAALPDANGLSLAELGLALGRRVGALPAEAEAGLAGLEDALGLAGREAVRGLLGEPFETGGDGAVVPPPAEVAPSGLEVAAVRALLDGDMAPLRDQVRTLLADPFFAYLDPENTPRDAYRDHVLVWCRRLADEGLGALAYPKSVGGGGDMERFVAAFETIGYHDLSLLIKFGVQFGLFGGSIAGLGSERHHRAYLPAVGRLDLPGGFAMSELGHGSNVRDVQTTATFDETTQEFVVHTPTARDHKEWIGNAARHGRTMTVFAQLVVGGQRHGVHALLVPVRDESGATLPGVRIEDDGPKMGLNGVDNGRIWFDEVRIPRANLLDRFAQVGEDGTYTSTIPSSGKRFFTMLGVLVGGRIAVAAGALSASKSGLAIAIRYGDRRRQFGPDAGPEVPLLDYLSHQRRLFPPLATAYGLNFAIHDLSARFGAMPAEADRRAVEGEAAALKAFASWHCTRTLQTARECCGGQGYLAENRLSVLKNDSDIFTTFEGDNTVLMLQVAKGLLGDYRQEFSDLRFAGLPGLLRERIESRLGELNLRTRWQTSEAHLRDPAWHRDVFLQRERDLLISAARRLKGRMDRGMDSFDAFVEVQDHLLHLARAHAERVVFERFAAAVEGVEAGPTRVVLDRLLALYALSHIEADRGWFLEQHYLEAAKAKAIRTEVNALCDELRPAAVDLADAFAIPDALLAAPIALGQRT